ncbi:MAG: PD-(D/E)XK nuclease family protein [Thermoleophilaceae bacterium]
MPLTVVTGPANAGKAGRVLGAYRDRIAEEPVLVVPALRDVRHAQRELASRGAVFGTRVVRFRWLFQDVAERCGLGRGRIAGFEQRELLVEHAVRSAPLDSLASAAARPGFARAAGRFFADLGRAMVEPPRLWQALRAWAGDGPAAARAEEVGALYAAYHDALDRAGLEDDARFAARALAALRAEPERWGGSAVFVYGFDDFTPLELELLKLLAGPVSADVTVSLPYEPDRPAFAATRRTLDALGPAVASHESLGPTAEHYAPESRAALHHLERTLFDPPPSRPDPGGAVRLLSAGGERAEVELVAAQVLELLRGGTPAGEVAVVFREVAEYASLVDRVFGAYGIPFSLERRVPVAHTGLGRGVLALLRCASGDGTADDLVAYLRTAGRLDRPHLADALESEVRRAGVRTAAAARELWEREWFELGEIDRLAKPTRITALCDQLDEEVERVFARPYRRAAHVFADEEREDPAVRDAIRGALRGVRELARAAPALAPDRARLHDLVADAGVRLGADPAPDRVQVARPEDIRARRFQALFVCGLQEGEFPRPARPEPFLSDEDRHEIASATGLVLPVREHRPERERYLFYACVSRAERLLALSWRETDEEGRPQVRSFFVDDVCGALDGDALERGRRSRPLAQVAWPPDEAPTEAEWRRAQALAGPDVPPSRPGSIDSPEVREYLAARELLSAAALEAYADCPVKWMVDRLLDPEALEPDPEPLVRGRYAHAVLDLTYRRLRERTGSRRVTIENLAEAEAILVEALRERQGEFPISPTAVRVRTAVRRLEFDLLGHLRFEAEAGGSFEPAALELEFGMPESLENRPLQLTGDLGIRGRIDRVDTSNGHFLVRDYKGGSRVPPGAKWEKDSRLQVALYMLAVRELMGLEPAGGVYVPLAGKDRRPRGLLRDDLADELGDGFVDNDRVSGEEIERQLAAARERAVELAGRLRGGEVRPCPGTCSWKAGGGCTYPSICRVEQ